MDPTVFELRVCRYATDWDLRRPDWSSWSDIGREFDGRVLDVETYRRVEDAYARAASAIHAECGSPELVVRDVEPRRGSPRLALLGLTPTGPVVEGASVRTAAEIERITRACLREDAWCRLEGDGFFLHYGTDLYMFVGTPIVPERAVARAVQDGLFVVPLRSPYHRRADEG